MYAFGFALLPQKSANRAKKIYVKGRSKCSGAREAGRRDAIEESSAAYAIWTVRSPESRNSQSVNGLGVPKVSSCRYSVGFASDEGHIDQT